MIHLRVCSNSSLRLLQEHALRWFCSSCLVGVGCTLISKWLERAWFRPLECRIGVKCEISLGVPWDCNFPSGVSLKKPRLGCYCTKNSVSLLSWFLRLSISDHGLAWLIIDKLLSLALASLPELYFASFCILILVFSALSSSHLTSLAFS